MILTIPRYYQKRFSYLPSFDVLSYQIMPDHLHLLAYKHGDRTLEKVRSGDNKESPQPTERMLSSVRSGKNISDLMQSIKGNFSRKIHKGNIWQKRFNTRIINNTQYLETIIEYIRHNPVKAKLPPIYRKMPYQYADWDLIHTLF